MAMQRFEIGKWAGLKTTVFAIFCAHVLGASATAQASTLEEVRQRGVLNCGVSNGLLGFSYQEAGPKNTKVWRGLDVDYCRAVAAAIFADPDKVKFVPLSASERFKALQDKKIDVLSRNTSWTMERDVKHDFAFVGISYFDGQGFMTRQENGLSSALQLSQAKICVLDGTTSQRNVERYYKAQKIDVTIEKFTDRTAMAKAYDEKKCDAMSADRSGLASLRAGLKVPEDHVLLPEVISKELLGPVVRQDDAQWIDVTRWVLFLLINAEEIEWTQHEAAKAGTTDLIAPDSAINQKLGLKDGWCRDVIKSVGNYAEIYKRNILTNYKLGLQRGINSLWLRGGLMVAPPM